MIKMLLSPWAVKVYFYHSNHLTVNTQCPQHHQSQVQRTFYFKFLFTQGSVCVVKKNFYETNSPLSTDIHSFWLHWSS